VCTSLPNIIVVISRINKNEEIITLFVSCQ